jgi:hypothetical protein
MLRGANDKGVIVLKPQSVATTATATGLIDTLGYSFCQLDVLLDSAAAVSSNPAVLKLSESDDTVVTNFADIAAFVGGGAGGFTVPDASTDTPQIVRMNVDLRKPRKRYLKTTLTPAGAAQLVAASARLSRADEVAISDAGMGCAEVVHG